MAFTLPASALLPPVAAASPHALLRPLAVCAPRCRGNRSSAHALRAHHLGGQLMLAQRRAPRVQAVPPRAAAQAASELPAPLKKIVTAFQMVPDPMQRYKQLLFYASRLKPLAAELHTPDNKVQGCVSQVWVVPELRDGNVFFQADSDSQLTKGLAALLVEGLSGCAPEEILQVTPDFIELLGLKQSLTPSRNNGFLNMLKLMQKKTLALVSGGSGTAADASAAPAAAAAPAPPADPSRPVYSAMVAKLTAALSPAALEIVDESASHAGHGSAKGLRNGETHFRLAVVSDAFEGLALVARHRLVYAALQTELAEGLHALSIVDAKTRAEAGH